MIPGALASLPAYESIRSSLWRIISPAVHLVLRWMVEILFWRHRNTARLVLETAPNDNQVAHPGDCPIMVSAFIQEKLLRLVVYYNSHSRALGHDHFASA
jgi:hypothetical protein